MKNLIITLALLIGLFSNITLSAQDWTIYSNLSASLRGNQAVNLSTQVNMDGFLLALEADYIYNITDETRSVNPDKINFGTNLKVGYNLGHFNTHHLLGPIDFILGARLNHSFHNIHHRDRDENGTTHFVTYNKVYKKVTPMLSAQLEGSQGPIVFGAELAIGKFYIYDFKHSNSDFKGLGSGTFLSFPLENGIHFFDTENDYSPPVVVQMNFSLGYRF